MTRIILTRHGQTDWNRYERFRGRADIPLNETGIVQAEAVQRRIKSGGQLAAIYTSPMSRSVKTAEIIAAAFDLVVQPVDALNDIHYGEWQGLTADEVRRHWSDALDTWYRAPHLARIPGGETLHNVLARTANALCDITQKHPSEDVVIVGHDCVNRILLLFMLGLPLSRYWHLVQGNCAINIIHFENNDFTVVLMNETSHLP
ncbi:MAG: histidine phosphatase family protein [Chloroflexi bacterium]|nr:histidine phosphatase family protein [Chloroflexota bacterium]